MYFNTLFLRLVNEYQNNGNAVKVTLSHENQEFLESHDPPLLKEYGMLKDEG